MRHAWMLLAHNQFPLLEKLLSFLDGEDSDIYLHIDARVKDVPTEALHAAVRRSRLVFVPRHTISWGHFSMVEAELELMHAAEKEGYDYYHLLSGVHVPISTREDIIRFFHDNNGKNFIDFLHPNIALHDTWRVKVFFPFQPLNIRVMPVRKFIRNATIIAQMPFVDRTRKYPPDLRFQKGSQWFSVTHEMVRAVLEREELIHKVFWSTFAPDELVMQTIAISTPLIRTLAPEGNAQYIDWERGNPYTFRSEDYEELIHTAPYYLFARKFDYNATPELVDRLYEHFGGKAEE